MIKTYRVISDRGVDMAADLGRRNSNVIDRRQAADAVATKMSEIAAEEGVTPREALKRIQERWPRVYAAWSG